jgi:hypothetical protein
MNSEETGRWTNNSNVVEKVLGIRIKQESACRSEVTLHYVTSFNTIPTAATLLSAVFDATLL